MSRFREQFQVASSAKRCGFIPFVVAGDPDLATTAALLPALSKLNPVAIEVGVPFSDPTADGSVIQRAGQRALQNGTTLRGVLEMIRQARRAPLAPLVLFSYYNPILQFGLEPFARAAEECGVAGVLAVDLPAEAASALHRVLWRRQIDLIFLVAPTTSDDRLRKIAQLASGFIYAVARTGITGAADGLVDESRQLVVRVRAVTELPIAVGFGIRSAAQAQRVCRYADAAVVGSLLVAEGERVSATKDIASPMVVRAVLKCAQQFAGSR